MSTETAKFTIGVRRVEVTLEIRTLFNEGRRTVDLDPVPDGVPIVSFTGSMTGCGGQIQDTLRTLADEMDLPADNLVTVLCDLWDEFHMNGMNAGTDRQTAALAAPDAPKGDFMSKALYLTDKGLNPDRGYDYGSGWLFRLLDDDDIAACRQIIARLDGQHFGETPDVDDAPDITGYRIDGSDVEERLEIYRAAVAAMGIDPDASDDEQDAMMPDSTDDAAVVQAWDILEEFRKVKDIAETIEDYSGDGFSTQLIHENDFVAFAKEFADDIGAINRDASWPLNHIDWKAAAEDLRGDYTSVAINGQWYWFR